MVLSSPPNITTIMPSSSFSSSLEDTIQKAIDVMEASSLVDDSNIQHGLDVIESLLETDWKRMDELSSYQKSGLFELRNILLSTATTKTNSRRSSNGTDTTDINTTNSSSCMVRKLETNSTRSSSTMSCSNVDDDDRNSTNNYQEEENNSSSTTDSITNEEEDATLPSETEETAITEDTLNSTEADFIMATNDNNNKPVEDASTTDSSYRYLLSEFHGIKKNSKTNTKNSKWGVMRKAVHANGLVRKLQQMSKKKKMLSKYDYPSKYAPPEWYELSTSNQIKLADRLSWENLMKWDFDIFEVSELCNGKPLLFVGWAILSSPHAQCVMEQTVAALTVESSSCFFAENEKKAGYDFLKTYNIEPKCMNEFLRAVESRYHNNSYHNNIHAADVLQTTHIFLEGMDAKYLGCADKNSSFASSPAMTLQMFSLLVSAAVHDVDHPGLNNTFQCNSFSQMALTYNDKSVLENYHASVAFKMVLGTAGNKDWNIFKNMDPNDLARSKKLITEAILGTDLGTHFDQTDAVKQLVSPRTNQTGEEQTEDDKKHDIDNTAEDKDYKLAISYSWTIMTFLMHMADISNLAKRQSLSIQWTDRILDEFFQQGDKEREMGLPISPLCDRNTTSRPDSQMGFINYIIRPSFELLQEHMPYMDTIVLPVLESNYQFWQTELEQ
mmetsp:Transcript_13199/g.15117  ORF Transcript_13199/g.15117 Transcript_13199/m.15117 type:complete len:669 (+) Transcript_13199:63-2069(+)